MKMAAFLGKNGLWLLNLLRMFQNIWPNRSDISHHVRKSSKCVEPALTATEPALSAEGCLQNLVFGNSCCEQL